MNDFSSHPQQPLPLVTTAKPTLENFVVLPGINDSAYHALTQFLPHGNHHTRIVTITGPSGSGKTHLAQAWQAAWQQQGHHVVTLNHLLVHDDIQAGQEDELIQFCQTMDVLVLDGLEQIQGKRELERRLFALYNALQPHHHLLITCRDGLSASAFALPDLHSRLQQGLQLTLEIANDTSMAEVIHAIARRHGLLISTASARYLINHRSRNLVVLASDLEHLANIPHIGRQQHVTIPMLKRWLI